MKNKNNILLIAALILGGMFVGCTDNYETYNKTGVDDKEGERDAYFLQRHFTTMGDWVIPIPAHATQFTECMMGGSYSGYFADVAPSFTDKNFATYLPEANWSSSMFNDAYSNPITSYKTIQTMTTNPVFLSVSKILKVMSLSRITDIYGPIPYSDLDTPGKLSYEYDSQQKVYDLMIKDLDAAIENLMANPTANFSAKADRIYGGNVIKWIKLANSLKLRLAVRMSLVDPTNAKKIAEEVMNNSIGPILSNADNANVSLGMSPNPYEVVMSEWNGGDSRIGADITSYMNGYKDPRMAAYFDPSNIQGYEDQYVGMRNGVRIPSPNSIGQSYSNMSKALRSQSSVIIMVAAEVAFLRAEGALRGWNMGGTAKSLYEEGIKISFEQWGASDVAKYISDATNKPQLYIDPLGRFSFSGSTSNVTIAWDAQAGFEQNLERIITQKWIAIYPNAIEAWSEFRRTGYPKLMPVLLNRSSSVSTQRMARRLAFPQSEHESNSKNVEQAINYLGGADNMATDLWWAKKN